MTPIERIRQKRQMVDLSIELERPALNARPFPRNSSGLAIVMFAVAPLVYKATLNPVPANIVGYTALTLVFCAGILLLMVGQKKQAIYDGSPVGYKPVLPFKTTGAVVLAIASAGLTYFQGGSVAQSLAVLPVLIGLSVVAFGLDPQKDKGLETLGERRVHKLEGFAGRVGAQMERIQRCAGRVPLAEVVVEIRRFDEAVQKLLCSVTDAPDRANTVRKYLTVYLDGVAEATERFAGVYINGGNPVARREYITMLNQMSEAYEAKAEHYSQAGQMDLDVQMEVLDDYLRRERLAG